MSSMPSSAQPLSAQEAAQLPPDVLRIYQSAAFTELRARRNRLALILTVAMCAIYYGFVLAIAFAPQLLAIKTGEVITLGIPVGLGVILASIALTAIYVRYANSQFDRLSAEARRSAQA